MQVSTAEFKKGLKIQFDGQPYTIVDFQHVKPGKGGAFVRTKLKHMRQGRVIDNTLRAGERLETVDFEERHMQYLYRDDRYHFMDNETYEQVALSPEEVGDANLGGFLRLQRQRACGVDRLLGVGDLLLQRRGLRVLRPDQHEVAACRGDEEADDHQRDHGGHGQRALHEPPGVRRSATITK